jgi:glyoxylase-like metal-dependent hydrolase (beta-lactamase superfamily II)
MIETTQFGDVTRFRLSRTLLGQNLYFTAAYWLDGLLIDTGPPCVAAGFFERARALSVDQVVNTHHHEDHVGANFLFEQQMGMRVQAHPRALPRIEHPPRRLPLYREIVWGRPEPAHGVAVGESIETPHHCLQVIYTPGHTDDHICLYDADTGYIFAGDLYLGLKVRVLRSDEDVLAMMESLRRVLALEISVLFCGSGKAIENAAEHLRLKLEFLEELQSRVQELHAQGWPVDRIRDRLLGREGFLWLISRGEFSKLNLVQGLLPVSTADVVANGSAERA